MSWIQLDEIDLNYQQMTSSNTVHKLISLGVSGFNIGLCNMISMSKSSTINISVSSNIGWFSIGESTQETTSSYGQKNRCYDLTYFREEYIALEWKLQLIL